MSASDWHKVLKNAKERKKVEWNSSSMEAKDTHKSRKQKWKPDYSIPAHVHILDESFFNKNFGMNNDALDALINRLMHGGHYNLNQEQQCAFHIIANHASLPSQKQLLMYIGGMGGTGKTRVLNAVMTFFREREELRRFKIVAPTGSAAALLGGETYHSAIGINDRLDDANISAVTLSKIRENFHGVQYIFIDEVSMLSCRDLAKISKHLALITGKYDLPFGGINMIFAGDFVQLPPVIGSSKSGSSMALYSKPPMDGKSDQKIEHALGKALWHQVTTVVIL